LTKLLWSQSCTLQYPHNELLASLYGDSDLGVKWFKDNDGVQDSYYSPEKSSSAKEEKVPGALLKVNPASKPISKGR
jgi:hypothetical protein